MRRAIIIAALLASGSALADWVVKCTAGDPAVVSVTGGSVDKVSSTPAAPWTPTYAISMNATNSTQYTESGVYVQQNWAVYMLVNIRSNSTLRRTGTGLANSQYSIGNLTTTTWCNGYGNAAIANSNAAQATGWHFITCVSTGLTAYLATNGIRVAIRTATTFTTNTTVTMPIGTLSTSASAGVRWDVARVQCIDPNGTVQRDLIATPSGTFTNAIGGATFTFGAGGTGGTSADSTNVTGQTFPTMNWAAGGGAQ